jgi:hypothetical protein
VVETRKSPVVRVMVLGGIYKRTEDGTKSRGREMGFVKRVYVSRDAVAMKEAFLLVALTAVQATS